MNKTKRKYDCQKSVGGVKSGGISLSVYFGSLNGRNSKGNLRVGIWLPVDVYQWILFKGGGGPAVARLLEEKGFVKWDDAAGEWGKVGNWNGAKEIVVKWAMDGMGDLVETAVAV